MSKTEFIPGDDITGMIAISCNKKLECKRLRVIIEGQLSVEIKSIGTVGKGTIPVSIDTITKTRVIYYDEIVISERTFFDPGTQKIRFQFKISKDADFSYDGPNSEINYDVKAIIDLPWRKTITDTKPVTIYEYIDDFPDDTTKEVLNSEGKDILEVEIDSQKYCIGDRISFRYRINTDIEFNSLRARIEHLEHSILKGEHTEVLWEESIPGETIIRHKWQSWIFNINKLFPPWIKSKHLLSILKLKVTLQRSTRRDKSVEIELFSGLCSKYRKGWTYAK